MEKALHSIPIPLSEIRNPKSEIRNPKSVPPEFLFADKVALTLTTRPDLTGVGS